MKLFLGGCANTKVKDTTIFKVDAVTAYYCKENSNTFKYFSTSESCLKENNELVGIIYPTPNLKLVIPKNFKGDYETVVFKAHHKKHKQTLFWHLNDRYLVQLLEFMIWLFN